MSDLEALKGEHISKAAYRLVAAAVADGAASMTFNGVHLTATPESTVDAIWDQYKRGLEGEDVVNRRVAAATLLTAPAALVAPGQDAGKLWAELKALKAAEENLRAEIVRLETETWVKREALIDAAVRHRMAAAKLAEREKP